MPDGEPACFICGEDTPSVLERHHIIPRRYDGTNDEKNLVVLCANCHRAIEKLYGEEFFEAVMEDIGDLVKAPAVSMGEQATLVEPDGGGFAADRSNEEGEKIDPRDIKREKRDEIIGRLINDVGLGPTDISSAFDIKRARISQIATEQKREKESV